MCSWCVVWGLQTWPGTQQAPSLFCTRSLCVFPCIQALWLGAVQHAMHLCTYSMACGTLTQRQTQWAAYSALNGLQDSS
jgi:hypothetical protein